MPPFQGLVFYVDTFFPGRCPGLLYASPFGLGISAIATE